jgi:hypothetical protein
MGRDPTGQLRGWNLHSGIAQPGLDDDLRATALVERRRVTTWTRARDAAFEHSPLDVLDGGKELRCPAGLEGLEDDIFARFELETEDTPGR